MSSFDMNGAVRFDLTRGQITMREAGGHAETQRALLPVAALAALCRSASQDALTDFGRSIGDELGRRMQSRLGEQVESASAQTIVDHLGGELALMGFGSLRLELWGRALVFALEQSALLEAAGTASEQHEATSQLVSTLIESAVARGLNRSAKVLPIARGKDDVRLLLCSTAAKDRVSDWLSSGCHYGEALARLNDAGDAA